MEEYENKVVLTLDKYTDLIMENKELKMFLSQCENKAKSMIPDAVSDYSIKNLTKEKCIEIIKDICDPRKNIYYTLRDFIYKYKLDEINIIYPMFNEEKIKTWLIKYIDTLIHQRLEILKETEGEKVND